MPGSPRFGCACHERRQRAADAAVRRELMALITAGGAAARSAVRSSCSTARLPRSPWRRSCWWRGPRTRRGSPPARRPATPRPSRRASAAQAERYGYASALAKLGRHAERPLQFNLVRSPKCMVASAAYLRARSLVRDGQLVKGRAALVEIGEAIPSDTIAASSALFLLGDLASDDQADRLARTYYRRAAVRYPTSRFAARRPLPRRDGGAAHRRCRDGGPRVRRAGAPLSPERRGAGLGVLGRPRLGRSPGTA